MSSDSVKWTALVLTCQTKTAAYAYQKELDILQRKGFIDEDVLILTVEDPKATIGSGGATLNALLVVAEHLSAQQGYTVVNADVLHHSHILIMHMGRNFPYDACGRAFVSLPAKHRGSDTIGSASLMCNIDSLLDTMTTKIAPGSPPGVWMCSTEMFLTIPAPAKINWEDFQGICAIAVPGSQEYAKNHGIYKIDKNGIVTDIVYQGTKTAIEMCATKEGDVALVTGVVFFSVKVAEKFLSFHVMPPIDGCTYMGMDSGGKPIRLSLFFDFLLCMASDTTEESFVSGDRAGGYGSSVASLPEDERKAMKTARAMLWNGFRGTPLKAVCLMDGSHDYMSLSATDHHKHLTNCPVQMGDDETWIWNNRTYSYIQDTCKVEETSVFINSYLSKDIEVGSRCAITHSKLEGPFTIAKNSILTGISLKASKKMKGLELLTGVILRGAHIKLGGHSTTSKAFKIYTVMGKFDNLKTAYVKGTSTFCNSPWIVFLQRTGIDKEDLWAADQTDYDRTLFNAKLFPVWHCTEDVGIREVLWLQGADVEDNDAMLQRWKESWRLSLEEILKCIDLTMEFQWRRDLFYEIAQQEVKDVLLNSQNKGLLPYFKSAVLEGYADQLLHTLDTIAMETDKPNIAARTLACIADVLGCLANEKGSGGLRSGPAANQAWMAAFHKLEEGKISDGVKGLAKERRNWLGRADLLVRAARHYEGAEQILIRHAVMTARQFISTSPCDPPDFDQWVVAHCPARIDLSGGWSDTPPVTYEHGGAVTNAAIIIDGKRPIGAKCRRIHEPHLVLVLGTDPNSQTHLVCKELSHLADYTNPQSTGALLKAAFVCADVVKLPSDTSLEDQLQEKYGGGFELHTWSDLPQGSGLGTSSILAGGVIAALWKTSGRTYDKDSLIHAVLHLEQMLTTGGGWQDQVGGLTPGIKIGRSKEGLPLRVDITHLNISEKTLEAFNSRLILLYTGKTRLARNLLQNVIRNWYARMPQIVSNCDGLTSNAENCAKAFEDGDVEKVGRCLDIYWEQKKIMAPGCEPKLVQTMMAALKPHVYGQSLAGAGGGGFMYVITKQPNAVDTVREVLSGLEGCENVTIHQVEVDQSDLTVEIERPGTEGTDQAITTDPDVAAEVSATEPESVGGTAGQTDQSQVAVDSETAVEVADGQSTENADTVQVGVDQASSEQPTVNPDLSAGNKEGETVARDVSQDKQVGQSETAEDLSADQTETTRDDKPSASVDVDTPQPTLSVETENKEVKTATDSESTVEVGADQAESTVETEETNGSPAAVTENSKEVDEVSDGKTEPTEKIENTDVSTDTAATKKDPKTVVEGNEAQTDSADIIETTD
ncbi:L-fucose kinase-like [Ptychodera flava]|uniref:L-fucose kinase-like n=1 Tax=Ptychodera flava TaxID=63121 RepID=UPI00396A7F92